MALLELAVTDLALLERARIRLGPGFTVITGETGAGKSLLIDALSLVLGGRADAELVRAGAASARVEALFDRDPEPLICVRELSATGRTVARIDDETVTVARLASTVAPLVEIHGQHEQQRLLSAAWQRELLDAAGGHGRLREATAAAVLAWRDNAAALRALELNPDELARRLALAEHAAAEIASVAPVPGEVAALRDRVAIVSSAERRTRLAASAQERLVGEGVGARDQLALAAQEAHALARLDPRLEPLVTRLEGLAAEAADIADALREIGEAAGADVRDAADLETRLGALYGLLRKYGETEEAVLAHGEASRLEAERLRGLDDERRAHSAADGRLRATADAAAAALSAARHAAAGSLSPAVTRSLHALGFPSAVFNAVVEPADLDITGTDAVTFLLAPNPGEPARPLARIASGGELSRVALAIKGVLAAADATPTLVFDEVDTGIGGRSADPVGESLWRLGHDHQVLCVTHLPQVAAHADAHLRIRKEVRDGRTVTYIHALDEEERLLELAAMVGGPAGSEAAAGTARALLDHARAVHAGARAAPRGHPAAGPEGVEKGSS